MKHGRLPHQEFAGSRLPVTRLDTAVPPPRGGSVPPCRGRLLSTLMGEGVLGITYPGGRDTHLAQISFVGNACLGRAPASLFLVRLDRDSAGMVEWMRARDGFAPGASITAPGDAAAEADGTIWDRDDGAVQAYGRMRAGECAAIIWARTRQKIHI